MAASAEATTGTEPVRQKSFYRELEDQINSVRELVFTRVNERAWEIARSEQGSGNAQGHYVQREEHLRGALEELRVELQREVAENFSQFFEIPARDAE